MDKSLKIKTIAIDDEPLALQQICTYIEKTPFLELAGRCNNAFEAIDFMTTNDVDLMFVDINMPELTGMDFVKSLKKNCMIIFTTAYSEYAAESFRVNAVDYLLKPIAYTDFLEAANKALLQYEVKHFPKSETLRANNDFIFIKSDYKFVRVNIRNIKYIEGMREYVKIYLENERPLVTLLSLKQLEEQLSPELFMRVHRSFIVNLEKVSVIERSQIVFDQAYIPIGDQYKERFQQYVEKNFL